MAGSVTDLLVCTHSRQSARTSREPLRILDRTDSRQQILDRVHARLDARLDARVLGRLRAIETLWPCMSPCCHPSSPDEAHSSRDYGSKAHRHEPQINAFRRDPDGHWHEPSSHPSLFHLTGCLDEAIFDWIHEVLLLMIHPVLLGVIEARISHFHFFTKPFK